MDGPREGRESPREGREGRHGPREGWRRGGAPGRVL